MLLDVVTDGFVLYCCGPRAAPNALAASYEWNGWLDLVTIRDFERGHRCSVPYIEWRKRIRLRGGAPHPFRSVHRSVTIMLSTAPAGATGTYRAGDAEPVHHPIQVPGLAACPVGEAGENFPGDGMVV